MLVKTQALVLSARDWGESDRILTLLSRDYGKILVYAKGAKKLTSHFMSSSQQFVYGYFLIKTGSKFNYLTEAEISENFAGLRSGIEAMSLAAYITEVASDVSVENQADEELLKLVLNTLYLISQGKKQLKLIKSVFELRSMVILGYQPDLECCRECGKSETKSQKTEQAYYLDVMNGNIICEECLSKANSENKEQPQVMPDGTAVILVGINSSVLAAMRHIVYGAADKSFAFKISGDAEEQLCNATEKYLLNQLEKSFPSLEFYKSL